MLLLEGKASEAVAKLSRAVNTEPNSAEAHAALGHAYEEMGEKQNAARENEKAAQLGKQSPQ